MVRLGRIERPTVGLGRPRSIQFELQAHDTSIVHERRLLTATELRPRAGTSKQLGFDKILPQKIDRTARPTIG